MENKETVKKPKTTEKGTDKKKLYAKCADYLKQWGLKGGVVQQLRSGHVWISEYFGLLYDISGMDDVKEKIREIETGSNCLVYHVIHTPAPEGDLYNFLFLTICEDEMSVFDSAAKCNLPFAYVYNKSSGCGEYGSVGVKESIGGLIRII